MTEFVPVPFEVNAGVELPAGRSASEDRTPAVHHTSPASVVPHVWLCSLSLRQLPVYSTRVLHMLLHHIIQRNCWVFFFFQEYTSIWTQLPCFCRLKMNSISVKGKIISLNILKKNAFLQKQHPILILGILITVFLFYITKSGILFNLLAGR